MTPMDPKHYPPDWRQISLRVRLRAKKRCECEGECGQGHGGRCPRENGDVYVATSGRLVKVVLTVAHLWQGPCAEHAAADIKCGDESHLKAMCQGCHLMYDLEHHIARRKQNRFAKKATGDLFA